ncbi:MAG TPA: PEP-CTERM sorting domain-containing protein [Tepidisphaeraceae bacterium]|nr:PEP-CTERM sorting domain-containing protein [Tepidisphaeraceae bacterium]
MRPIFVLSSTAAAIALLLACGSAEADVSSASVNEQVSASASQLDFSDIVPIILTDTHSDSNIVLPPNTISVSAAEFNSGATADVTIASYSGPTVAVPTTPGLTLDGSISATASTIGGFASSSASISYQFSLDTTQPFTYSNSGTLAAFSLIGPSGSVATGSGNLAPGAYTLSASMTGGTSIDIFGDNFSLTVDPVPEPASMAIVGIGVVALPRCRRR